VGNEKLTSLFKSRSPSWSSRGANVKRDSLGVKCSSSSASFRATGLGNLIKEDLGLD
jgi:hypothetical protein